MKDFCVSELPISAGNLNWADTVFPSISPACATAYAGLSVYTNSQVLGAALAALGMGQGPAKRLFLLFLAAVGSGALYVATSSTS